MRACIEVADIFRAADPTYRATHAGHVRFDQLQVMSAIEACRTAIIGGHVETCTDCGHWRVAYNSCRNRHCPRCQGAAARTWLAVREADLLPVGYFHVVFTLPAEVTDIAWQNKAAVYGLLFQAASETMMTIAIDPKHRLTAMLRKAGERTMSGLWSLIERLVDLFQPQECASYFSSCGYDPDSTGSALIPRRIAAASLILDEGLLAARSGVVWVPKLASSDRLSATIYT